MVKVRFAPSPTGYLHLGGARTALLNYLFTKHSGGKFVVRFEDTDSARNKTESENEVLKWIRWLGIKIDETVDTLDQSLGPYRQSERMEIFQQHARQLINMKKAYPCFCTVEELTEEREKQIKTGIAAPRYNKKCRDIHPDEQKQKIKDQPFCIRLKIACKNQEISFHDMTYGLITFNTKNIEDFIILRSNGMANYNFAVAIDDYLMKISHVIRGADHVSNTPKQLLVYQAFGWTPPVFGHVTLIKMGSKKMSKRHFVPEHYLEFYETNGYMKKALVNYLAFLGWVPPVEKEVYSMEELIEMFNGKNLSKNESSFDIVKLNWFNQKHLQKLNDEEFVSSGKNFIKQFAKEVNTSFDEASKMTLAIKNEIKYWGEIKELVGLFYNRHHPLSAEEKTELAPLKDYFETFLKIVSKTDSWTVKNIYQGILDAQTKAGISKKKATKSLFFLITGQKKKLNPVNYFYFLGQTKTKKNLTAMLLQLD